MIKLVCSLGNPGPSYSSTRHNAGRWVVDTFVNGLTTSSVKEKFNGYWCTGDIKGQKIFFFEPKTYMNVSGLPIAQFAQYFKIKPEEILVAHDETALAPGLIKLKQGGGSNGHNGIKDCIAHLAGPNFYRLKVGIGRPLDASMIKDYVLKSPSISEIDLIRPAIEKAADQMHLLCSGNIEQFMHILHTR